MLRRLRPWQRLVNRVFPRCLALALSPALAAANRDRSLAGLRPRAGPDELLSPAVRLAPKAALALSMALHELMTNAAKYGSLSAPEGQVRLTWRRSRVEAGERLQLRWEEIDGPPVVKPTRQGFGTRLITGGLARELGGSVVLDHRPAGVVCEIDAELARTGQSNRFIRGAV